MKIKEPGTGRLLMEITKDGRPIFHDTAEEVLRLADPAFKLVILMAVRCPDEGPILNPSSRGYYRSVIKGMKDKINNLEMDKMDLQAQVDLLRTTNETLADKIAEGAF